VGWHETGAVHLRADDLVFGFEIVGYSVFLRSRTGKRQVSGFVLSAMDSNMSLNDCET